MSTTIQYVRVNYANTYLGWPVQQSVQLLYDLFGQQSAYVSNQLRNSQISLNEIVFSKVVVASVRELIRYTA